MIGKVCSAIALSLVIFFVLHAEGEQLEERDREEILSKGSSIIETYYEIQPDPQNQTARSKDISQGTFITRSNFLEPVKEVRTDESPYPESTLSPCLDISRSSSFFSAIWNGIKCIWGIVSYPFRHR